MIWGDGVVKSHYIFTVVTWGRHIIAYCMAMQQNKTEDQNLFPNTIYSSIIDLSGLQLGMEGEGRKEGRN